MKILKKLLALISEGTHVGTCVGVIGIGTQVSQYGSKNQAIVQFELPDVLRDSDENKKEPAIATKFYSLTLNPKSNLRKDLESWFGSLSAKEEQEFELNDVLGKPALLNIVHQENGKGETRAKIASVTKLPKGMKAPKPVGPLVAYDIEDGRNETYEALPEWIQDKIEESLEFRDWEGDGNN